MGLDFGFDRTSSEFKRYMKTIKELNSKVVGVGFTAESGVYDGSAKPGVKPGEDEIGSVSVADVAAFNEFGTENMPSRPFMRDTIANNADEISRFKAMLIGQVMKGADAQTVLNQLGTKGKGLMQREIRNGSFAANADSTIRKKGSSRPLIDTARMRQSVVYVVREKRK